MFFKEFVIWHFPYFLFGGIVFLVLLLCCVAALVAGLVKWARGYPAGKYLQSALWLSAILAGMCAVVAVLFMTYMGGRFPD